MDMELEAMLRPPARKMPPYPAKAITLATGKPMVVRQVGRKAVPKLLEAVKPTLKIPRDYYDIVGARGGRRTTGQGGGGGLFPQFRRIRQQRCLSDLGEGGLMKREIYAYRCRQCGHLHYPFRMVCKECRQNDFFEFDIVPLPKQGKLLTFTKV